MYQCAHCGRPADLVTGCPYCGQPAPPLALELERLDRDIAEMSAQDLAMQRDRSNLSAKMQAALHQRALLQAAQAQRTRRPPKQRGAARRVATLLPNQVRRGGSAGGKDKASRTASATGTDDGPKRRDRRTAADIPPEPEGPRPEASSRSVQNVLLALGGLLLGVAAITFTVAVLTALDGIARAAILIFVSAAVLMVPPFVVRRALTATAETIASVGLILVPLAGYAIWQIDAVRATLGVPATGFTGLVSLGTAAVALAYQRGTGLTAPRYIALIAVQPAVPLLAYEWILGPAGWALVFAAVAAANAVVGRALGHPSLPSVGWLREVAWIAHGIAVGAALVYAGVALATAGTVTSGLRAGATLIIAAAVGMAGALSLRREPLPDVAAAVMTLAVIASAARVAAIALPGRALVFIAATVAVTGVFVRMLPPHARRGPQVAASVALGVLGIIVAGAGIRAAAAPIRAVLPPWEADLSGYAESLANAVGPAGWQLAVAAALSTVAAALAVPPAVRREATVAGAGLTALATPASFALGWTVTPWVLLVAAIGIGVTGLAAPTERGARTHVGFALIVGVAAAAASLAEPSLTAGILTALTAAGTLIGLAPRFGAGGPYANLTAEIAQGTAVAAAPGAVACVMAAAGGDAVAVLAMTSLAVSAALGYAALSQVAQRRTSPPVALGGTLGALATCVAAFVADGETADTLVALLLLVGALLLWFAPMIDAGRPADRWVDGPDIAAAAITAAAIGALARVALLIAPGTGLVATAALVLLVALGVRAMPAYWRPGPSLGCGLAGALVAAIAAYFAVLGGFRALAAASPVWHADLGAWSASVTLPRAYGWQVPAALLLLAAAAAVVMPLRARAVLVPACITLTVIAAPAALELHWSSPVVLGLTIGTVLGLVAVSTAEPHTGTAWATAAAVLGGFAIGGGLVQPWLTASALAGIAAASIAVAGAAQVAIIARSAARTDGLDGLATSVSVYASPRHLVPIGGAAVTTALLALPGAIAAAAASLNRDPDIVLAAGLAAASLGLAIVAVLRRPASDYLTYAVVGVTLSTTGIALIAVAIGQPYGFYAAAAALLGVLIELLRAGSAGSIEPRSRIAVARVAGLARGRLTRRFVAPEGSGVLTPGMLAAAGIPALLAMASIAPGLTAVLVDPHRTLSYAWAGPDAAGVDWSGAASGSEVIAALLLTLAAALAAVGYGERAESRLTRAELIAQVVPVVIPGIAVTLLIAPSGLGLGWPAGTVAALLVFTIAMLGVALTDPPPNTDAARALRVTRWLVLAIGLAAGGAGLAGSLAARWLTLATLAGAVGVGLTAALGGRTTAARVTGWGFASASAHMFAYVLGLAIGLPSHWSAFGVMAVAALALVTAATLPRLRRPQARGEAPMLEWSGYAGALLSLALAVGSLTHLAALLAAWGAVLGIAAVRPNRSSTQRRVLLWAAVAFELAAWCLVMWISDVGLIEAYTLPFAALALLVGVIELRHHPELGSWAAYGPALVAASAPTLAIVLVTDASAARRILLLLGAVATVIAGSMARQRAPVVVGGAVTTIAALHEIIAVSDWLIFIPIGVLLVVLGATYEKRRRDMLRLRASLGRMR